MKRNKTTYIKNILLPCFVFSLITGIFTGILIFLFKLASDCVMGISGDIYGYVRSEPEFIPLLLLGAAVLGLISALILKNSENCRGGGIPTSVAILRGLVDFHWLKSVFWLFASACVTFLGGVPLGNEGPSVQMGTAVGRGTVRLFAKKHKAWDRYIMTGGACGGFAAATGAPLTGIFFAFEEAHRRFSPMLFMTAATTVSAATATMRLLCSAFNISPYLFDFAADTALPLRYLWVAVLVGLICGFCAVLFTGAYSAVGKFLNNTAEKLPFTLKIVLIFVLVALTGVALQELTGSGHDIITELIEGQGLWYLMLICFCVRAIYLMLANNAGISGGIFIPTLTFGALIGAFFSKFAVICGLLPAEYYAIPIIIGMASFLAASSRTPITAVTFALEALSGIFNILPIAIGVTLAFTVIETFGVVSLHDTVINKKVENYNRGKETTEINTTVVVMQGSFAVGKEVRDVLWPPTCTVLSIEKPSSSNSAHEANAMGVGDILHIHYLTHEPNNTVDLIEAIVGEQTEERRTSAEMVDEKTHIVPEI